MTGRDDDVGPSESMHDSLLHIHDSLDMPVHFIFSYCTTVHTITHRTVHE